MYVNYYKILFNVNIKYIIISWLFMEIGVKYRSRKDVVVYVGVDFVFI